MSATNHAKKIEATHMNLDDDEYFESSLPDYLAEANAPEQGKPSNIKKLKKSNPVDPSSLNFYWMTDEKRHHVDHTKDRKGECPTAEVLLQRGLNLKKLSEEEEYDLISRYQSETDPLKKAVIKDEIVSRNLRLVMYIAKKVARKSDFKPIDLMSWGVIGLIRALDKYSFSYNARLSTFAIYWIRQEMTRGIANTNRSIRVPYNIFTDQNKMKKFCRKFLAETGVEAEDEDICEHFKWKPEKLAYVRKGLIPVSSIDLPATDGDETIADLLEDDESVSAEDEACDNIKRETILRVIEKTLDERSRDIILNLFDFNKGHSLTKDQLAEKYHVTRERILQIRDESISMLRHPAKSGILRGFLH